MPPVVYVVGTSESGKTTIMERLIAEFKRRGYHVATVKHVEDFELDQAGKDSWRHARAGSDAVILSAPHKLALQENVDHDATVAELSRLVNGFDIILAEGFKHSKGHKIEVHRRGLGELICDPRELMALVTDEPLEAEVPQFQFDDATSLADLIERRLPKDEVDVGIFVNGKQIPLSPFPKELISRTLFGMVSVLKQVEEPQDIELWVRKKVR